MHQYHFHDKVQPNGCKISRKLYDKIKSGVICGYNNSEVDDILKKIAKGNSLKQMDKFIDILVILVAVVAGIIKIIKDIIHGEPFNLKSYVIIFSVLMLIIFLLILRQVIIRQTDIAICKSAEDGNFLIYQYPITDMWIQIDQDSGNIFYLLLNDFYVEVTPDTYEHVKVGDYISAVLVQYKNREYFYI